MKKEKKVLPDGCYEIVILGATIERNKSNKGHRMKIFYEVIRPEEFNGYFDSEFRNQSTEDNHWHGFFFVALPERRGECCSLYITKKFEEFMQSLTKSNPNYVYDRKLSTLRGLHLGAHIETHSYTRTNGSDCEIKTVTKICSVEEFELERCDYVLPFLTDEDLVKDLYETNPKRGDFYDWI